MDVKLKSCAKNTWELTFLSTLANEGFEIKSQVSLYISAKNIRLLKIVLFETRIKTIDSLQSPSNDKRLDFDR